MEDQLYCPNCGEDVYEKDETEYGIICARCHQDFWASEALKGDYKKQGYKLMNLYK